MCYKKKKIYISIPENQRLFVFDIDSFLNKKNNLL